MSPDPTQRPRPLHFNGLTPAEAERLACLSEELGEAQQAIGKILRHGYESSDPTLPPELRLTNRESLACELGHVTYWLLMLQKNGDIPESLCKQACVEKAIKVQQYLHHQAGS